MSQLSLSDEMGDIEKLRKLWEIIPAGHQMGKAEPLFKELKDEVVDMYREKFAGSQADRAEKAATEKAADQLKNTKISDESEKKRAAESAPVFKAKSSPEAEIKITRLIRVGVIRRVEKHPDADCLYVEEIDVGEATPRTVVSCLVKYIPLAEMQVEIVEPPKDALIGERISFVGFGGEPDDVLNPKKKVWETLQPDLNTGSRLAARCKDTPFTTSAGICKVLSIANVTIR